MYHVSIFTINIQKKYSLLLRGMLIDVIHTNTYFYAIINHRIVYGFFHFPDYKKEHTVGEICQQRIHIPPWHQILPFVFVNVCVCFISLLSFSFGV